MTDLPLHTRRLVEQLLDRYCARICAPPLRRGVQLAWRIEGPQATIAEHRLFCGVPGAHALVDVRYCAILGLVQDQDLRKRATGGPVST